MKFTPAPKSVTLGYFKEIDGEWHKRCTGPAHEEPTYLPATEKYFFVRKKQDQRHSLFFNQCRLCCAWGAVKKPHSLDLVGMIEASLVRHFYFEAANRIGIAELKRRTGVTNIHKVIGGQQRMVRRENFRLVLLELISIRRKGENSISSKSRNAMLRKVAHGRLCSECGTSLENYTVGCDTCWERKRGKTRRENMSEKEHSQEIQARVKRRKLQKARVELH